MLGEDPDHRCIHDVHCVLGMLLPLKWKSFRPGYANGQVRFLPASGKNYRIFSQPNITKVMYKRILIGVCCLLPILLDAQSWTSRPVSLAVFNNATMLPPASLTAVFNQPLHPGMQVSYEFSWKETDNHKWFQDATLGFYSQRYAFRSLLLYSKAGYRRYMGHFSAEGALQAGYMHMFLISDRLVFQDDGTYKAKKGFGKPQFITGAGIGIGYDLGKQKQDKRIFLTYDVRLQMPFVSGYVPLLPNGILTLGYQTKLF